MKIIKALLSVLVTIGAVNWGLVGANRFDVVSKLLGRDSTASRIVYGLVGLAGLYHILKVRGEVTA